MSRLELAQDIASGLAGWLQLQAVQKLGDLSGEDSARLITAQIVNAQGRYEPAISQLPQNWGSTKKRVDIALKARQAAAETWYGAVEIKWPGMALDWAQTRLQIVQDAMRVTFIQTNVLNAHFLVLGGSLSSLSKLFDTPHPGAPPKEAKRLAFLELFRRDLNDPKGGLTFLHKSEHFPEAGERVPATAFNDFRGKLKTELLAEVTARFRNQDAGHVYVWQCNRTRGPQQVSAEEVQDVPGD